MMTVKRIRNFIPLTKQKRSDIMGVSPLVDSKGVIHINDNKLPELVSDQFASVSTHDDGCVLVLLFSASFAQGTIPEE